MSRSVLAAFPLVLALAVPVLAQDARRDEEKPEEPPAPTLTAAPVLLEAAPPDYPPEAARAGLEASVKVRLHIDDTGRVTRVEVLEPAGHGFDEAAAAAARQYRFEPAEWDGVPGAIAVETTIHFVIEETEEEVPLPSPRPTPDWLDSPAGPASHAGDPRLPVNVDGVALERGSRRRLAGVIVSIAQLGLDAVTDAEGRFAFHGVPPGNYDILALADGFDRFQRQLELDANEAASVRLYLRARGGNPYETVVEGEREVLEVTRRTIERRQMQTVPGTFGDPIRVVQTLPGLARTPFTTGFLIIRGSNPADSGVFIDGHRIPQLFHFLGGPSILNAEFLEKLDLYPGGFPARFGRGHGGVIAVDTRPSKSDGVHGAADVDFLDASGYVRFPVSEHGSLAVAGRRSYLDFMLGFFLPDQKPGQTLIVVPVYYDYQLRFDYDLRKEGHASVFVLGSSDQLKVLSEDVNAAEFFNFNTRVDFFRVIATYKRPVAGDFELTLSPAFGRDSIEFGSGQTEDQPIFTGFGLDVDTFGYRMRLLGKLSENVLLDAGVDIESRIAKYRVLARVPFDVRENFQRDQEPIAFERATDMLLLGVHADVPIDIGRLRLIPGLRLDGYLLAGKRRQSVDPRLVGRYRFNGQWTGKGYLGLFHQPPQPETLDHTVGNPDLGLERAVHTGVGAEWKFAEHWSADAELYYINRHGLVRFRDRSTEGDFGEVRPINFDNSGGAYTVGMELLVRREVTRNMFGWLSYTLSRTLRRDGPDESYYPYFFDQRHIMNAVLSYKTDGGWEFGGRYRLATGSPQTDVIGSTYDSDSNDYRRVNGPFRADRRKTFQQLDVRAERTWVFDTWMIGVYLDILNALNTKNEEAIQFDYRFRDRAPITSVPFIPTLGVRGQW